MSDNVSLSNVLSIDRLDCKGQATQVPTPNPLTDGAHYRIKAKLFLAVRDHR